MTIDFRSLAHFAGLHDRSIGITDSMIGSPNRLFFLAAQGGAVAPIPFAGTRLQRMRVIVVERGIGMEPDALDALADQAPQFLPPRSSIPAHTTGSSVRSRPVRGEIVRDENGHCYERVGHSIRPLHQLVSGPDGELYELLTAATSDGVPRRSHGDLDREVVVDVGDDYGFAADLKHDVVPESAAPPASAIPPERRGYRPLLADRGLKRIVRWGPFKEMLAAQMKHPERLREDHRVACRVQVYEVTRAQRLDALAAAILGEASASRALRPLTEGAIVALRLVGMLPPPTHQRQGVGREPGMLLPHDRIFHLQLSVDPTADATALESSPHMANGHRHSTPSDLTPATKPADASVPHSRSAIPEKFLSPWGFRLTRDEALYDMTVASAQSGSISRFLRRLAERWTSRGETRRWKMLLCGRTLEEQLWTVRPPKMALWHPGLREWARSTLELAGYDPHTMLTEWEIFWRRKGL